jgi:hypothetical protein
VAWLLNPRHRDDEAAGLPCSQPRNTSRGVLPSHSMRGGL